MQDNSGLPQASEQAEKNRRKGNRNERKACNILRRLMTAERVQPVGNNNDPFRLADVIGIRRDQPTKLVQVKTNSFPPKERKKYASRAKLRVRDHTEFEVWVREDYHGWRFWRFNPGEEQLEQFLEVESCDQETVVEEYRKEVEFDDWEH